jgi:hypothetical protein
MANRSTVKSNIITKNVPSVTNAILTDMLNTEMADNLRFREDTAKTQNSGISNITVNFSGYDRIDLTRTGGTLIITVAGMGDGEEKYLLITKTAGQAVTWSGVTDITPVKSNANALATVLYQIVRKGSNYFAWAWVENVQVATDTIAGVLETGTTAEHNALTSVNVACVPGRLPTASTTQKGLTEHATATEVDAGTSGNLVVIASELKRKYDELNALITTINARAYVRDLGTYHHGDVGSGGDSVNIMFATELSTADYRVEVTIYTPAAQAGDNDIKYRITAKTTTYFTIALEQTANETQDCYIDWVVIF